MLSSHVLLSDIVQRPGTDRKSGGQDGPLALPAPNKNAWECLLRFMRKSPRRIECCAALGPKSQGETAIPLTNIYFAAVAKAMETMKQGVVSNITKSCSDRASLWI
jgi:hypothetical protein